MTAASARTIEIEAIARKGNGRRTADSATLQAAVRIQGHQIGGRGGPTPGMDIGVATGTLPLLTEAHLRILLERLPAAVYMDRYRRSDGSYIEALYVSPQMESLTGYPCASFMSDPDLWLRLVHPDDRSRVFSVNVQRHVTGVLIEHEYRIVRADGRTIWVREEARCVEAAGTDTILSHGFLVDITDRKELEQQLSQLAFHDPLTGLANRALFGDRLTEALSHRSLTGLHPAVLYLDLDNFKAINDSLGHAIGDRLLQVVGERIRAAARSSDCVARIGGDEFAILLPAASAHTAIATADRVIEVLRQPIQIERRKLTGRASVGVAVGLGEASSDLLRDADAAMYRAKATNRGGWVLFEPAMHREVLRRFTLEADLRSALAQGDVGVAYQVVHSLVTGRATGAEALARWNHPILGEVSPATFIGVAEESDLIVELGLYVLRKACQQAADWRNSGIVHDDFTMGVNVSGRQMGAELPAVVAKVLSEVGLPARCLVIEITETAVMGDTAGAIAVLTELRHHGVAVAIDDFGTGYSSLGYLRKLPIDIIKIDQSFVREIERPVEAAIVGAVIQVAAALSMVIVAEGIETKAQATALRDLGCRYGQGFLFGHPAAADGVRISANPNAVGREGGRAPRDPDGPRLDPPRPIATRVDSIEEAEHVLTYALRTAHCFPTHAMKRADNSMHYAPPPTLGATAHRPG